MLMWLYKLKTDWVVGIDKLVGVTPLAEERKLGRDLLDKPNSNGGMRTKLSDFRTEVNKIFCLISNKFIYFLFL